MGVGGGGTWGPGDLGTWGLGDLGTWGLGERGAGSGVMRSFISVASLGATQSIGIDG
mgnify:CR=1 FL=1